MDDTCDIVIGDPPLLVVCSPVADPTRAPEGHHALKVNSVQPDALPEGPGHGDDIKDWVSEAHLDRLRPWARNRTDDKIPTRLVKSPQDLERTNPHNRHGTRHGGAQGPSQAASLRPVPGGAQHGRSLPGLHPMGATTPPGGSVPAGRGRNAAAVLLRGPGLGLEQAIGSA